LMSDILALTPKKFDHYFEPFFGGGALFFTVAPTTATLSDINAELIDTYVQVRDNLDAVLTYLRRMPNTEADYYRIRSMKPRTPAGNAARLIYLCTLSFNGIHRRNRQGDFNVPYGYKYHLKPCDEHRLRRTSEVLQGKKILVQDFESAVRLARRNDLVYFDPPYTVAHGNNGFIKYNATMFSWSDQKRLASVARRLKETGCNVIVSNADHSSIHELYTGFNVHLIQRHSVMAASSEYRRPVQECLFY